MKFSPKQLDRLDHLDARQEALTLAAEEQEAREVADALAQADLEERYQDYFNGRVSPFWGTEDGDWGFRQDCIAEDLADALQDPTDAQYDPGDCFW